MGIGKYRITLISLSIFLLSIGSYAQNSDFISGFSVRVSPGIMSFYGDLSATKFNPIDRIRDNSKMGFTIAAIKEFNPIIGIQAQYTAGNLYSTHATENMYFTGSLSEFSVTGKFTPLGFFPDLKNRFNLQPYLTFGLGSLGYRSCKKFIDTDKISPPCYGYDVDGETLISRENGLVLPFGLGLSIPINKNLAIDVDHTYRFTNTDLLDGTMSSSNNNDWYSLTSIGLRFTIEPSQQTITRRARTTRQKPHRTVDQAPLKKVDKKIMVSAMNIFVESLMDDVVTSGEVFAVNLRINKGSYTGPAKLVQRFPKDFTALEASSTNGRFTFSNRNVLIEWDNMPADSMISYTYYVRIEKDVVGSQTITGRFEYEENDKWNTVRFNNYIFADKTAKQILDEKVKRPVELNEVKENEVKEKEVKEEKRVAEKTKTKVPDKSLNIDPLILKDPVGDIEFRIQCGAFKDSDQGGAKLIERYGITENVREVLENGWYKYTVGSFTSYVDAVNYKNSFIKKTKLYTVFIVAYKNGKRVKDINDAFK